jgi:chemotaxis protein MotB
VRGYADQMLRIKNKPTDPSNRRVSILVKNDNAPVPTLSAANVVNGSTPLPSVEKPQAAAKNPAKPLSAPPAAKPDALVAPIKTQTTAKLGRMDKLKGLLPGTKK